MNSENSLLDFFSPKKSGRSNLDMASIFKDSVLKTTFSKTYFFDRDVISKSAKLSSGQLGENEISGIIDFKAPTSIMKRGSPKSNPYSDGNSIISNSYERPPTSTTNSISKLDKQTYFPSPLSLSPVSSSPLSASLRKDPISFMTNKISNFTSINPLGMSNKNSDISNAIVKQLVPILPEISTADCELKENDFDPDICYTPLFSKDMSIRIEISDQLIRGAPVRETDLINSAISFDIDDVDPLKSDEYLYQNHTLDPKYTKAFEDTLSRFISENHRIDNDNDNDDEIDLELNCIKMEGLRVQPPKRVTFETPDIAEIYNDLETASEPFGCDEPQKNQDGYDTCCDEGDDDGDEDEFSFSLSHNDEEVQEVEVISPCIEPETKNRNWFLSLFRHRNPRDIKSGCHVLEDLLIEEQKEIEEKEKIELDLNVILKCMTPKEESGSPSTFYTAKTSPSGSIEKGKMIVMTSSSLLYDKRRKVNSKTRKMRHIRDMLKQIFLGVKKGEISEKELTELHRVITNAGNKKCNNILSVKHEDGETIKHQQIKGGIFIVENQPLMNLLKGKGKVGEKALRRQLIKCIKQGDICILEESNGRKLVTIDISQMKQPTKY